MIQQTLRAPELVEFRKLISGFVDEEMRPYAKQWERDRVFPNEILEKMAKQGFLGLSLPEAVGGRGKSLWYEVVLAEELAKSHALGAALSLLAHTNMIAPLLHVLGSSDQQEQVLRPALEGRHWLALAVTEPGAGSDVYATSTVCEDGRLTGHKKYITNGSVAKYHVVLCKHAPTGKSATLRLLVLDAQQSGVRTKRLRTTGFRCGDTAEVFYEGCAVEESAFLGKQGKGFYLLLKGLHRERLLGAVALNSLSRYVLEKTISYLKAKKRFGSALSKKQVIRHKISSLYARLCAAEQLAYSAVDLYEQESPSDEQIISSKIVCYELAQEIITYCAHLHGAEAFLEDNWVCSAQRDLQAFTLAAGTSEVMRELLAGLLRL